MIDIIEIIVWTQIIVICMLFAIQPTKATTRLSMFYGGTLISHAVLFQFVPFFDFKEFMFYVFGGMLDFAVIIYTCRIREISRLAADIQNISMASIMFNTLGIVLSYAGVEPESYMLLFVALYSYAIWALIRGESVNDGTFEVDTRLFSFSCSSHKRVLFDPFKQAKK